MSHTPVQRLSQSQAESSINSRPKINAKLEGYRTKGGKKRPVGSVLGTGRSAAVDFSFLSPIIPGRQPGEAKEGKKGWEG